MNVVPLKRRAKRFVSSLRMHRIDSKEIACCNDEIRLFMAIRNEALRLPAVIQYYVDLGVDRFFIVDNDSSDGSVDYLLSLPNVHVFITTESFERKEAWLDHIIRKYGMGTWCIIVDADELFMFPFIDHISLRQFTEYMDAEGFGALHALLLDMYSNQETQKIQYTEGDNLVRAAPYFDPISFRKERFVYSGCSGGLDYQLAGGLRARLFHEGTICSKFPLIKFNKRMFIPAGCHSVENAAIADSQGVLLHFKFLQDFIPKARIEAEREVHWGKAATYKNYAACIDRYGDVNPCNDQSIRYEGSSQLLRLGAMEASDSLVSYVNRIAPVA